MKNIKIDFSKHKLISPLAADYISGRDFLKQFYKYRPAVDSVPEIIKDKSNDKIDRNLLADIIREQYSTLKKSEAVEKNISLLTSEKTFTVTTGHQLNLFTGPLYFVYKIVTALKSCQELKRAYPDYNFVPVYWMASEDHDFEEISFFRLNGKKFIWKTEQQGPVGRFQLNELKILLKEIPGALEPFKGAYEKSQNLADAVRRYVNDLFGAEGLIVIDEIGRAHV